MTGIGNRTEDIDEMMTGQGGAGVVPIPPPLPEMMQNQNQQEKDEEKRRQQEEDLLLESIMDTEMLGHEEFIQEQKGSGNANVNSSGADMETMKWMMELQGQVRQAESMMHRANQEKFNMQTKLKMLEETLEKYKKELEYKQLDLQANSYSKFDQGKQLHPTDVHVHSQKPYKTRYLYSCRCPVRCVFPLPCQLGKSSSPSQFVRMMNLHRKHPELDSGTLFMLSQRSIPGISETPNEETWKILSTCPSMMIWHKEVVGWEENFDMAYSSLLEESCGKELLKDIKMHYVALPGVTREAVAVELPNVTFVVSNEEVTAAVEQVMKEHQPQVLVVVVPHSTDQEAFDTWQATIALVPSHVDILITPAHMTQFDHRFDSTYCQLFNVFHRKQGLLSVILPDEPVGSQWNEQLLNLSNKVKVEDFWLMLKEVADEKGFIWPNFRLQAQKESVETQQNAVYKGTGMRRPSSSGSVMKMQESYQNGGPMRNESIKPARTFGYGYHRQKMARHRSYIRD